MPRGHAGERIQVATNMLSGVVSLLHHGKSITLDAPDLERNAYDRRARAATFTADNAHHVTAAASIAFQRDLQPLVDEHGGFRPKGDHHDPDDDPHRDS